MGTSSCGLTPQIQRIMALSFLRSLCKFGAVGAQISIPCNRAERMQAPDRCLLNILAGLCRSADWFEFYIDGNPKTGFLMS